MKVSEVNEVNEEGLKGDSVKRRRERRNDGAQEDKRKGKERR